MLARAFICVSRLIMYSASIEPNFAIAALSEIVVVKNSTRFGGERPDEMRRYSEFAIAGLSYASSWSEAQGRWPPEADVEIPPTVLG